MLKMDRWLALIALIIVPTHSSSQTMVVQRLTLHNGLRVLAVEDHSSPSVAIHIVFKVGSRNERPGITGISHLFEHMMFNGSAKYPPKVFDQLIEAGGGFSNAFTSNDTTEYYEEFSTATLDTALKLEADRMRALKLDKRNIEQERSIVKEERRVSTDNSVEGSMNEVLWNTAFVAHPYRWVVVGFMKDIDAIRLEDAKDYFKIHYAPNNAVMAVVGDFNANDLLGRIQRYFGDIPSHPAPRGVIRDEPVQRGERRATLHMASELPAVSVAYHTVDMKNGDAPALEILANILSQGESSRLYHDLVYDKQIAASVYAGSDAMADPGIFEFYAQAQPNHAAAECEHAIYSILDDIRKNGVTERELQKAKNQLLTGYVNNFKTNDGRAAMLSEYEANWGNWIKLYDYVPRFIKVKASDIKRLAEKYFKEDNRTVVTLVPIKSDDNKEEAK